MNRVVWHAVVTLGVMACRGPAGPDTGHVADTDQVVDTDSDVSLDTDVTVDTDAVGVDADRDGAFTPADCDDADASVHPGAPEDCDPIDRNCDGDPVLGAAEAVVVYLDADGDGYGAGAPALGCLGESVAASDGDCDDHDAGRHPDAFERCNGVQDDCAAVWHIADEDGHVTWTQENGSVHDLSGRFDGVLLGGTYDLCPGRYAVHLTSADVDVALVGHGATAADVVLDGGDSDRVWMATRGAIDVTNLTLAHGSTVNGGGNLYVEEGSSLTVTDVVFDGGVASAGGALYSTADTTVLTRATVSGATAEYDGGGMFLYSRVTALTDVTIEGCTAAGWGGGLHAEAAGGVDALFTATGLVLRGNRAHWAGGAALYAYSDTVLTLRDVLVEANTASELGGGLLILAPDASIEGGVLRSNVATSWEGGGLVWEGNLELTDVDVLDNHAWARGGGGGGEGAGRLTIHGGTWSGNSVGIWDVGRGGGLYVSGQGGVVDGFDVRFEGNSALAGGGVWLERGLATFTDCTLQGNTADVSGGGAFTLSETVTLIRTTLTENVALIAGGGVAVSAGSLTLLDHSTIVGNSAVEGGGVAVGGGAHSGVFVCGAPGADEGASVRGNRVSADGHGAGVRAYDLTGGTLQGWACDMGEPDTSEDNTSAATPTVSADTFAGSAHYAYGDDATFTCDDTHCF